MAEEKKCSSCGGVLHKGFFYIRNSERPNLYNYVVWVEGEIKDFIEFMRAGSAPQFPVSPYKCESCGHVELFAETAEKWKS